MKYYYMWGKKSAIGTIIAYNPDMILDIAEYLGEETSFPNAMLLKQSKLRKGKLVFEDFSNYNSDELWTDRLGTNLAIGLFSEKFKNIIEQNLGEKDCVEWISVNVIYKEERQLYYMARFPKFMDVLNTGKTMYVDNTSVVIVPCISQEKTIGHNFFTTATEDWKIPQVICVSAELRKIIKSENCTGMSFSLIKTD